MSGERFINGFEGQFRVVFNHFVTYRRSLGFSYGQGTYQSLQRFCKHLNACNLPEISLPKEVILDYLKLFNSKAPSTLHNQESLIRQLGLYMKTCDYKNVYIYPESALSQYTKSFVPYIFSNEEIHQIFIAADSVTNGIKYPEDKLLYSVVIRLLYATGLRVSEALNLKEEDVDLINDIITVRNGKNNVSRLIPFLPSLHKWLKEYNTNYGTGEGFFFKGRGKNPRHHTLIYNRFIGYILPAAGINPDRGNGHKIRVHDLRHTFACHSLDKAIKSGRDPFCVLPYLSAYMGHKDIKSTELYLRLTEQHFNEVLEAGQCVFKSLEEE